MNPYRHEPYGWRGPRGSYYGRGNVKFAILDLLKEKPRHGYDIIREMEERSGGVYSPSPGVIYPTLQALEDQDFVKSAEQDGKKVYSITEAGLAYLQGQPERTRTWPPRRGAPRAGSRTEPAGRTPAPTARVRPASLPEGEGPHGPEDPTGFAPARTGRRRGAPGSPRAAGPSSCGRCAGCSATSPARSSGRSAIREKLKEIREVLREAKTKIDEIVMR